MLDRSAAIATLVGIPFILLLMYCAWLPLMMGMYFFILGGMIVGAVWFRLASRVRPVPAGAVRLRMFAILLLLSSLYMVGEYGMKLGHLSRDMANLTIERIGVNSMQERQAREQEAAEHVRRSLRRHGPGPIGYWVWAATSGDLPPMPSYTGRQSVGLTQKGSFWIFRVVASIALLGYGLRIMAGDLARPDTPVELVDEAPAPQTQAERLP